MLDNQLKERLIQWEKDARTSYGTDVLAYTTDVSSALIELLCNIVEISDPSFDEWLMNEISTHKDRKEWRKVLEKWLSPS